MHKSINLKLCS